MARSKGCSSRSEEPLPYGGALFVSDHHPIELIAPDISAYRAGNTGIDYVTTFDSGIAGPHVMVSAVTHGNGLWSDYARLLVQAGYQTEIGQAEFLPSTITALS